MNIASKLNQTAVYWAPSGASDKHGTAIFSTPVEVSCRWEGKRELFTSASGEKQVADATVYVNGTTSILINGYMFEGVLTDLTVEQQANPSILSNAFRVMSSDKVPGVSASQSLRKVLLGQKDA